MKIYNNIVETIGDTPLIKLNNTVDGIPGLILGKVEYFNPGHSTKDRMALSMVNEAEKSGRLKPGGTIVECTSGNTGMGLALIAVTRGYKCIFTTTDKQAQEKVDILRAVGAEVIVCKNDLEADHPDSYYSTAERISKETPNSIWMNQYDNLANRLGHYQSTGPEIWDQTDGKITHFVVATGTGGTISGTGKYLKEKNPDIKLWAIDTFGSTLKYYHEHGEISEDEIYPYLSEGFGEDIVPKNIDFDIIDLFEKVSDKDGALATRELAAREGLFLGYSAGSVLAGLRQLKSHLKPTDVVVLLFHDHGSRYLAKVYNDKWMKEVGFLS